MRPCSVTFTVVSSNDIRLSRIASDTVIIPLQSTSPRTVTFSSCLADELVVLVLVVVVDVVVFVVVVVVSVVVVDVVVVVLGVVCGSLLLPGSEPPFLPPSRLLPSEFA